MRPRLYGPRRLLRKAPLVLLALASAGAAAGCGTEGISVPKSSPYYDGAVLFLQHCSGCHTLSVVGAQGSATNIKDRLRNQGPNFDVRKETVENVLYAIRNGGFSGQVMPQNVVVGEEAQRVAQFLAHYAGSKAPNVPSITVTLPGQGTGATGATGTAGAPTGGTGATGGATGATGTAGAVASRAGPARGKTRKGAHART